ncbi:MAG: LPS assembly protein LptD, partial [Candidatus Omnitrophota bacterium]
LRLYLDWRQRWGTAEGFGLNYDTIDLGRGDFKFYYTQERRTDADQRLKQEFQRYLVRFRHLWDVDSKTQLTAQYYRIQDNRKGWYGEEADFLRDYFYREYEKETRPRSYLLLTRSLPNSNINMLVDKRTNRWYGNTVEKLPEISYDLPGYQAFDGPLYFKNRTIFSNLDYADSGAAVVRLDSYNQLTLPSKFMFVDVSPYLGLRETGYSRDKDGSPIAPRTTFYTGADMSTRFFRTFNVVNDFLGMNINRLRHVITPRVQYSYVHEPTVSPSKLQTFDDIDSINGDNRFTLELENKLQTKREENPVDLAIFRVSSDYIMYSKKYGVPKSQDRFTDFLFDLELTPYSWLRMEADAAYDHRNDYFSTVNFDNWFNVGEGRSFALGHRYQRKGGKEMTSQLVWPINPKWSFRGYWRYQFARTGDYRTGLREQEYTISRDLHCATIDVTLNRKKVVEGKTDLSVWFLFNLKIFKESEFDYKQSYHPPKQ